MKQRKVKFARAGLMSVLPAMVGLAILPPAWAQQAVTDNKGGLAEVVVTAQKRTQNLQKTSLAVTAVTGEKINEQGLTTAAAVLADVPNVVVQGHSRGSAIAVRGIGSDLPPSSGESSVSTNTDGVYNYRAEGNILGYYDLARVEVLRGPQSTLYGRNATAGVVNVHTANPKLDKLAGYTTVELGNYNLKRVETVLNVPIAEKWAARLAYVDIDRKGYYTNGGNDAVATGFRGKLLYKDGDDLSVLLGYERNTLGGKGNQGTKLTDYAAGNYYYTDVSSGISQDYAGDKFFAEVNARLGPGNLTFLPSYQYGKGVVCDGMMGPIECSDDPKSAYQRAFDLRYSSLAESSIQWVVGLYYYNMKTNVARPDAAWASGVDSVAAYGQATYPLAENLRAIAGLRAGKADKFNDNFITRSASAVWSEKLSETSYDFKLGLEYDVNKASMTYLTLASGHRPGGFIGAAPTEADKFQEESMVSFEVGSKNRFLDGKVQLNGALFYYDYKNFQASDFYFDVNGDPQFSIFNIKKVKNYGLELEGKARVASNTTLNGSLTALSSTYAASQFLHDPTDPFTSQDMNGKTLPHAPKLSLKVGVEQGYDFADGASITGKLDARYISEQYVAPYPGKDGTQPAYTTVDASLMYRPVSETWSLNLYGRNLTNKTTKTALFGNEVYVTAPRQYGVTLTIKY